MVCQFRILDVDSIIEVIASVIARAIRAIEETLEWTNSRRCVDIECVAIAARRGRSATSLRVDCRNPEIGTARIGINGEVLRRGLAANIDCIGLMD